jgi:DNA-binding MarR family transcriptional regulator
MNPTAADSRPVFTTGQGQYLAFIHACTLVNGRPPAEADIARFFGATAPTVHQMIMNLERASLISRQPGSARTIAVLIHSSALPALQPGQNQLVKITVTRY